MSVRTITLIGCGKVGKTLSYLLQSTGCYQIQQILGTHWQSAEKARQFLGEGQPIISYDHLIPADVFLIAVNDDQLQSVVHSLKTCHELSNEKIVFHCSGSFSHEILSPLRKSNTHVASLHPIKCFSDPRQDIIDFTGTYCTLEGDPYACQILHTDFKKIGAHILPIPPQIKSIYHIATIFASNYFITLIETSLQLFDQCGISKKEAFSLLEPLVMGAWERMKESSPEEALTGPISRGDSFLVKKHLQILSAQQTGIHHAYQALGILTMNLAAKGSRLKETDMIKLKSVLLPTENPET